MPYVHYLLECLNPECLQPIPLPPPKSHDKQPNQAESPTVGWKHFFLCLHCKQVNEYSEIQVQTEIRDTQDQWEHGECLCWSIQYDCDIGNCDILIETFAVSDKSEPLKQYSICSTQQTASFSPVSFWEAPSGTRADTPETVSCSSVFSSVFTMMFLHSLKQTQSLLSSPLRVGIGRSPVPAACPPCMRPVSS